MRRYYASIPALVATLYSCGNPDMRNLKAADKAISRAVTAFAEGDLEHYISWSNKAESYAKEASGSPQFGENAERKAYITDLMPKALEDPEAAISLVWKSCAYGYRDIGAAFINAKTITDFLFLEHPEGLNEEEKKSWYSQRDELEVTIKDSVLLFYERYKNFIATQELKTKVIRKDFASAIINCSLDTPVVKGNQFDVYMSHENGMWQIEDFSSTYFLGADAKDGSSDRGFERNLEILSAYVSDFNASLPDMIAMLKGRPISDALVDISAKLQNAPKEDFSNDPLKGAFIKLTGMLAKDAKLGSMLVGEDYIVLGQTVEEGDVYLTVKKQGADDSEVMKIPISQVKFEINTVPKAD